MSLDTRYYERSITFTHPGGTMGDQEQSYGSGGQAAGRSDCWGNGDENP